MPVYRQNSLGKIKTFTRSLPNIILHSKNENTTKKSVLRVCCISLPINDLITSYLPLLIFRSMSSNKSNFNCTSSAVLA